MSDHDFYPEINWNNALEKKFPFDNEKKLQPSKEIESKYIHNLTYLSCPEELIYKINYHLKNGEVDFTIGDKIIYKQYFGFKNSVEKINFILETTPNNKCVNKDSYLYKFLKSNPFVEQLMIDSMLNNKKGMSVVKNPYLYGEVSISRSARTKVTANYIFKPFLILSSLVLMFYWLTNYRIMRNECQIKTKSYLILGILSAIFLSLHALGIDLQQKISFDIKKIRSFILTSFVFSEILAQFMFARSLYKNYEKISFFTNYKIIFSKILFVYFVILVFFSYLFFDFYTGYKGPLENIVEWNFFNFLLLYYLISSLLWKKKT